MNNRVIISDRDEDLFSYEDVDDEEENYINRKGLIHLENDKSVTIDESFIGEEKEVEFLNRVNRRKNGTPLSNNQNNKINHHEELLKFIADTSDIFDEAYAPLKDNWHVQAPKHEKTFKTDFTLNKFELFLPADTKQSYSNLPFRDDRDRLYTLQSQSLSSASFKVSNNYKEKFEMMEAKYNDLFGNYNKILDSLKEWQLFYIKLFNIVNLPIPTEEFSYNVIFNNNYKDQIINIVDMQMNKSMTTELKICKEENVLINKIVKKYKISKNDFFQLITNKLKKTKICKSENFDISSNAKKFNSASFKIKSCQNYFVAGAEKKINVNNLSKKDLSCQTDINFSIAGINNLPKRIKITEPDFNKLAPFSGKSHNLKEKKRDNNYLIVLNERIEYQKTNFKSNFATSNFLINICPSQKIISNSLAQTNIIGQDILKLESLQLINEEYSEQLILYKKEKEEIHISQSNSNEKLKEELNKIRESQINNTLDYNLLYPEMIAPEHTFRIFLHCVRHFKYEDDMYKKLMNENDVKSIRDFLWKVEDYIKDKEINQNIKSNTSTKSISLGKKKFLTDGFITDKKKREKETEEENKKTKFGNTLLYSKYKSMIKNIMNKKQRE